MNKFLGILFAVVLIGGAVLGGLFGRGASFATGGGERSPQEKIRGDYSDAVRIVTENYAGKIEADSFEKLTEDSIQGMLYTLDPHSSFFTAKEFQKLNEDQSSRFYGIGVSILQHRDGVYVQSIVEGTPAAKAGLRYGDKFLTVDGKDALKWTSAEVSRNVRGERGVAVKVRVERAGERQPVELSIIRDAVPFPSIRNTFMIRPNVGYIGLTGGFQETTSAELDESIEKLKKQGMKQLVLDLRGNPGGLLPESIGVSSRFIKRGERVLSVRGRSDKVRSSDYNSTGENLQDVPLVVLINGFSASASEIVAGAIQDHARGLIVGERSFGKGLVQRVFGTPLGTGLTLTTARYYTPYGRSLQKDYSTGSIYDYYTQHTPGSSPTPETAPTPTGTAVETAGGRVFYGGGGIEPDVKVKPAEFNQLRNRIAEAAFQFTRRLANGDIAGLEGSRIERGQFDRELRPTDLPVTDRIFEAFRDFVAKDEAHGLKPENLNAEIEFAKVRLREEMVTAAFSSETGQQVLLDVDPQILKAIEIMPDSKKLAESIRGGAVRIG